jgi:hypothetical protein
MSTNRKPKIYSHESHARITSLLPKEIQEAMAKVGWNVFGIYEVVQKVLKEEKKKQ